MEEITTTPQTHTSGMRFPLFSDFLGFFGCVCFLCREEALGKILG